MDRKLIDYLSLLARLNLTDKEKELYAGHMSAIFSWVEQIGELDLSDVSENVSKSDCSFMREDKPVNFQGREAIIKNFTDREFDFLKVKKVIED